MNDPVLDHLLARRAEIVGRIEALVRIPSVSADPARAPAMAEARALLIRRLTELGFAGAREMGPGERPAVCAERLDAGADAPTLLVYGHYDVQPPEPLEAWASPPFEPETRDGRLYGRGVSDDKAPTVIALETLGAFLAVERRLPVNVRVLIEGAEELGGLGLPEILSANREALACDAALSADGARWRADLPTMTVASRGTAGFEFRVTTAGKDLHSGRYGGAVGNALSVMAGLVASLHREDGSVACAGFYDRAAEPSEAERAELAAIPFDEAAFRAGFAGEAGSVAGGEARFSTLERMWLRPTLEVTGMWGGWTGPGGKTVIPHEARAKISLRLVAGQDPAAALASVERHLRARLPEGAGFEITWRGGASAAYALPGDHPLLLAAEGALRDTTGRAPLRVRMGASMPLMAMLKAELGVETVMFSFSTSDEDFHAPNEHFRLSSLDEGFAAWTRLLRRAGEQRPEDYAGYRG